MALQRSTRRGDKSDSAVRHLQPQSQPQILQNPHKSTANNLITEPEKIKLTSEGTSSRSFGCPNDGRGSWHEKLELETSSKSLHLQNPLNAESLWNQHPSWNAANFDQTHRGTIPPHAQRSRSYAEVVSGNSARSTTDLAKELLWQTSSPREAVPVRRRSSLKPRRRVSFAQTADVIIFHREASPAFSLGRHYEMQVGRHYKMQVGRPNPRLVPGEFEEEAIPRRKIGGCKKSYCSSPVQTAWEAPRSGSDQCKPVPPEESYQEQWQLVKSKYWWRKERRQTIHSQPPSYSEGTQRFKALLKNRCYNCLSRGHYKAKCRDPPKCWRCLRSGHISHRCRTHIHSHHHLTTQDHSTKNKAHCSQTVPAPPSPSTFGGRRKETFMERRLSLGGASAGARAQRRGAEQNREENHPRVQQPRGENRARAVDFPGNPRFRPRVVDKIAWVTPEMQERREMLTYHAVLATEEGPPGIASTREVKDLGAQHFGIGQHEFQCREFHWQYDRPDGDVDEDFLLPQPTYYRDNRDSRRRPRDGIHPLNVKAPDVIVIQPTVDFLNMEEHILMQTAPTLEHKTQSNTIQQLTQSEEQDSLTLQHAPTQDTTTLLQENTDQVSVLVLGPTAATSATEATQEISAMQEGLALAGFNVNGRNPDNISITQTDADLCVWEVTHIQQMQIETVATEQLCNTQVEVMNVQQPEENTQQQPPLQQQTKEEVQFSQVQVAQGSECSDQLNPNQDAPLELNLPRPLQAHDAIKEMLTVKLPYPLLAIPKDKIAAREEGKKQDKENNSIKRSVRIKNKNRQDKPTIKLAQEMLARKWGILDEDKALEKLTLQQYLDIYRKPLTPSAMEAIKKLSQVAQIKRGQKAVSQAKGAATRKRKATQGQEELA